MDDRAARDIRAQVEALQPWFHNLHLPGGIQSAPNHFLGDFPSYKWQELSPWLPGALTGWRVLDIGCNAGFCSFELARRGARVTAVDANNHYLAQARWAAGVYGLEDKIDFLKLQVYDLIEHRLARDPTNWWASNPAALEAMLRSAGFRVVANPEAETYLCEPDAENAAPVTGWTREEFIAATGRRSR